MPLDVFPSKKEILNDSITFILFFSLTVTAVASGCSICSSFSGRDEHKSYTIRDWPQLWVKLQICGIDAETDTVWMRRWNLEDLQPFPLQPQTFASTSTQHHWLCTLYTGWLTPNDCSRAVCRSSFSTVRLQSEHTHRGSWRALGALLGCDVPFWPVIPASEGTAPSLRSHRHKRQRSPAV